MAAPRLLHCYVALIVGSSLAFMIANLDRVNLFAEIFNVLIYAIVITGLYWQKEGAWALAVVLTALTFFGFLIWAQQGEPSRWAFFALPLVETALLFSPSVRRWVKPEATPQAPPKFGPSPTV